MKFFIIALGVAFIMGYAVFAVLQAYREFQSGKADRAVQEEKDQEKKKNETKEQMETGDTGADINASIDILHNLSKKGK